MKNIYSRHLRDFVFRALLSLLTCVAGTLHAGAVTPRNPIAKVTNLNYTKTNTIVTLKLWMYNYDGGNAHFVGDVWLTIDGKKRKKLNDCWSLISNAEEDNIKDLEWNKISETQYILAWDNEYYGDLEFGKLSKNQQCPDNSNKSEKKWSTAEIKLTFKKVFPYYGHKITIEGTWRDRCDDKKKADKYWSIDNEIGGYVRPAEVKAGPLGSDVVLSWQKQGYNKSSKANGKWVVYKVDGKDYAKLGEKLVGDCSFAISKKKFECGGTYCIAFLPDGFNAATPASGLSAELILGGHAEKNDVCQRCGHGFMHYKTRLKEMVRLPKNADFGAVIVSHKNEGDCKFVIECDGPITRIPSDAFSAVQNCLKDDNLSIPTTVTHIGDRAFCRNALLTGKLVIPPSVKSIGREAFMGTNFSGDLVIPNSVGSIGYGAFSACNGFNGTLTLPKGLKVIESCAFNSCTKLKGNLTLPDNLTSIGDYAFYICRMLTGNLVIPKTVKSIGERAFASCSGFNGTLTLHEGLETIGNDAFWNCHGLKGTVTLPPSLESISEYSFADCGKVTAFEFKSLPRGMKEMLSHATVHRSVRLSDASYVSEADNSGASIDELSYTRDNPGQWNTLVLPCDLTLTGEENHVLYKIDKVDDDKLVVSQVKDKVAAGTPCLFLCGKSDQKAVTITANKVVLDMTLNTVNVDGLTFIGTYHTQKPVKGWVFSGNKFDNIDNLPAKEEGYSVSPFSAWLEGAVQGNPWSLGLKVNNPATGIAPVTVVDTLNGEGVEYYDLSGQRLDAPRQGVNIVRLKSGKAKKLIIK